MSTKHLVGIILMSTHPEQLAAFYRETLGIPFETAQHGTLREHIECEVGELHFAILKKGQTSKGGNITPSFAVPNLADFVADLKMRGISTLHPIIDLGDKKQVTTISDPDGNAIRLIQIG
jgi:predicted enzyme related to lactoylglutathione lyase